MLSKKEIKVIQSLSHKKFRDEAKLFVAEGAKIVNELIERIPSRVVSVFATLEWLENNKRTAGSVKEISEVELSKISLLQSPNQVVAIVRMFEWSEPVNYTFSIYLDAIQDPGNLGTIIRTADWFNIKNIVCGPGCADLYNPKTVQATMASIVNVELYYDKSMDWLPKQNKPIFAATLNGTSLYETQVNGDGILIIGNESKGVSPEVLQYASKLLTIPRMGRAESLNAAVATGVILSHLFK